MKNILIVDDHPMIRLAVENTLSRIINPCTIHVAGTLMEAKDALRKQWMDLIILDLSLPDGEGLEMISILRNLQSQVRILIYSGRDEVSNAPVYVASGANGFLHKNASSAEFETAVNLTLNDKKYIRKEIQQIIVDSFVNQTSVLNNPVELLTPRERQILAQLLKGKWTKQIAHDLQLKISTVSTHKARILEKIQVKNVIELLKKIEPFQNEI